MLTVPVSSPFENLSDIGSPGVDGLPKMPKDPNAYVVAAFQAPPSPDYVLVPRIQSRHHLHHCSILSKRDSTKAEIICSSWSSWTVLARSAAGRTGRLLDGGFAFFIAKNGIVNEN
ncbi:hypothetical protein Tco_0847530 [Tanacetum coccineum]